MGLLDTIEDPRDLRDLDDEQLTTLAAEIRERIIASVASNGSSRRTGCSTS